MMDVDVQKRLDGAGGPLELSVQFELKAGQTLGIYGASGAGKTSTLRMLAGLLKPDAGHIIFNGKTWFDGKTVVAPGRRRLGYVFQDYALFPNMTVHQNLAYAAAPNATNLIEELLKAFALEQLANTYPNKLSGGQQQRAALARALVQQPDVLLLDEPLNALDEGLRNELRTLLKTSKVRWNTTTILVSHDQQDLLQLADKLLVLQNGQVTYQGKPADYFTSTVEGVVVYSDAEKLIVSIANQQLSLPPRPNLTTGQKLTLTIN